MVTEPIRSTVLHNVVVQEPGRRYVQKPKVIENLDFSKLKYEPQATKVVKAATEGTGFISTIKTKAGKLGGSLKAIGSKLIKSKRGKIGLIAAGIGALLLGAGALLKGCDDKNTTARPQVQPTPPQQPVQPTQPEKPTQPTQPAQPAQPEKPTVPPALPGEKQEGTWLDGEEMLCKDASGRTRDIKGKLTIIGEYEKNPEEFTITDNSSGSDHVYKYKKIGVTDDGKVLYKCISMNDAPIISENQYTLEGQNNKNPRLIQHKGQDNYGIGLKVGKAPAKTEEQTKEKDLVDVWINRMPGPGHVLTLETFKEDAIYACQNKRPLTNKELENIHKCQNEQQVIEYLKTIGFNLSVAV